RSEASRSTSALRYNLRRVAHALQFLDNGVRPAVADQQHAISQPADDVLSELLAGEEFLRQRGILGGDQRQLAMQLYGDSGFVHIRIEPQRHRDTEKTEEAES